MAAKKPSKQTKGLLKIIDQRISHMPDDILFLKLSVDFKMSLCLLCDDQNSYFWSSK